MENAVCFLEALKARLGDATYQRCAGRKPVRAPASMPPRKLAPGPHGLLCTSLLRCARAIAILRQYKARACDMLTACASMEQLLGPHEDLRAAFAQFLPRVSNVWIPCPPCRLVLGPNAPAGGPGLHAH